MIKPMQAASDGDAYESNDAERIWTAGIDFPHPRLTTWHSRIECHGESKEDAEELRDAVLASITQQAPQPLVDGMCAKGQLTPESSRATKRSRLE